MTIPLVQSDPASTKRLHIVQTKKGCPLSFEERLVWSAVIYRTRLGQGATRRGLARLTGLHRTRTLPKVAARLLEFDLVVLGRGKRLFAKEPAADQANWFAARKSSSDKWEDRMGYLAVILPGESSKLTTRQNALYWLLESLQRRGRHRTTHLWLAGVLSVNRSTIGRGLNTLQKHGLVKFTQGDRRITFECFVPEDKRDWFCLQPKKQKRREEPIYDTTTSEGKLQQQLYDLLLDQGCKPSKANFVTDISYYLPYNGLYVLCGDDSLAIQARRENSKTGKTSRYGNLLAYKIWACAEKTRGAVDEHDREIWNQLNNR